MSRILLDIYALHTVPPSNLNRDDTGSPKSAVYGGVRRSRVSSQAWKKAIRDSFRETLNREKIGYRTKRVVDIVTKRILTLEPSISPDRAEELATIAFQKTFKIKMDKPRKSTKEKPLPLESSYLLFLSALQIDHLAQTLIKANETDNVEKYLKKAGGKKLLDTDHSVDLALFGRMVADASDLNVDAAAQVAHAISVHPVENEFDYYTANDDNKDKGDEDEDAGAGMIGTIEFNSATLYRYATVDVNRLLDNLGDATATAEAVEAFIRSFTTSIPSGKQNTFAHHTLPDAIVISLRDTQSVNLAGAFENAIRQTPRVRKAAEALTKYAQEIDGTFETTPLETWVIRGSEETEDLDQLGKRIPLSEAISEIGSGISEKLAIQA